MIHEIAVNLPRNQAINYPIKIGVSLYNLPAWLPKKAFSQIVIITDHTVKKHYGLSLNKSLKQAGYKSLLLSFPAGEKSKQNKTKQTIEDTMFLHRCDKNTLIIALGGGVVGDLAGFIAATYLRGIPYIQIPTSLLAMVDSSVGGKTGINTKQGKNLIGIIYQPICVVADITTLKTLSQKNIINGLIEAIKMFLTHDAKSFYYTESNLDCLIKGEERLLKKIVARAIKIKANVVSRDEQERGERSVLNLGHTIGHALEKISNYRLLHGYAVAYGILVEATISHLLGLLDIQQLSIIKNFLAQLGIHGKFLKKYELAKLIQATKNDKKVQHGNVNYILLHEIGNVYTSNGSYIHPVPDKVVRQALKKVIEE